MCDHHESEHLWGKLFFFLLVICVCCVKMNFVLFFFVSFKFGSICASRRKHIESHSGRMLNTLNGFSYHQIGNAIQKKRNKNRISERILGMALMIINFLFNVACCSMCPFLSRLLFHRC